MAFIRPYESKDFGATAHICRATLPSSLRASPEAVRLCAYIWTHQYTFLSPETSFVLDDGTGHAVGYCISCPDIESFCKAYPRYVAEVLLGKGKDIGDIRFFPTEEQLQTKAPWVDPDAGRVSELALSQLAFSPKWLLLEGNEDLLSEGYNATLHIDLLDEWQGKGWGRKLIEKVVESVKGVEGSKGIWLGVAGENSKVVKFYERMGFRCKDRAKDTTSITMVRDFET